MAPLLLLLACNPLGEPDVDDPARDAEVGRDPVSGDTHTGRDDTHSGGTDSDSGQADSDSDSGDSAATDTGDTSATDTGDTSAGDTGDTGTSPTDTADTADTGTSSSDTADTGTSSTDTGDTDPGSTDTGGSVDTGESLPDSADTGTPVVDTGGFVDTGTPVVDTAAIVDTGTSPTDTAGGGDPGWTSLDTADTADIVTVPVDTADTGPESGTGTDTAVISPTPVDTADTADTGKPLDTGNGIVFHDTGSGPAPVDTDTSVYVPAACDSGDTGAGCSDVIRFVALGDAGTGDYRQLSVASAIEAVCAVEGCDFALYLGDNLYPSGPSDVTDVLWDTNFEVPYSGLGFQFYAVLGNHDYGGFFDTGAAAVEVAYTAYSSKWYMPSRYYTETIDDLTVIGLDTQALQLGRGADQEAWIPGALAGISTTWTIAIGHHPYISNGPHGDAGEYDGRAGDGVAFKDFFDSYLCGTADVYLAGHDHALQWLQSPSSCDTAFLVAGGGGSGRYPIVGTNPADFEDSSNGFLWVELDGNLFTGVFYDSTGTEVYRASFTK